VSAPRFYSFAAGLTGALAIALGAFGAHGMEAILMERNLVDVWKTASTYHLIHSVLLLFLVHIDPFPRRTWWVLWGGIVVFSGTLYLMGITDWRWLGAITPIGGTALIVGWVMLAFSSRVTDKA